MVHGILKNFFLVFAAAAHPPRIQIKKGNLDFSLAIIAPRMMEKRMFFNSL